MQILSDLSLYMLPLSLRSQAMNLFSLSTAKLPLLIEQILAPVEYVMENYSRLIRDCPGIPDRDFVRLGFQRNLSQVRSGRDFLQQQREVFDTEIQRSSFFDSLHSRRRLDFLAEVSWQLYVRGRQSQPNDLLEAFPELRGRRVWAGDGHKIEHAAHAFER